MWVEGGKAAVRRPQEMAWERSRTVTMAASQQHSSLREQTSPWKWGVKGAGTERVGRGKRGEAGTHKREEGSSRGKSRSAAVLAMQGFAS